MAIVLKDRVKETATAPGTGTITLGGATSGFQSFSAIGNGNVTYFAIVDTASGAWEVNYGTYTSSGTTLTRNATPLSSSAAGALIDFTNSVEVFCTYPSEKAIYEETSGNVLIDGGPITVIGTNVTSYTTFSAALGEMYGNVNSFAQLYARNLNSGSEASADMIVYRDNTVSDSANFMDMGINSSTFSSATWPIFTPSSMYLYGDGGELFIGSGTDDVVFFAGGVDTTDEAMRIDKTTKALTTVSDVNVGAVLDVTGAATFGDTVTLNADPSTNLEAATKQYVDNVASLGIIIHPAVRLEAIGNLNAAYSNGTAGVGATLTNAGTQAALELDGVAAAVNDRVLVADQTTQTQNGVYVVTDIGSILTDWVLTRATDADTYGVANPGKLAQGSYFYIQEGDTAAGESYVCATVGTITFGTTAITFSQFSAAPTFTGGTNIDVSGQIISLTGTVAPTNGGTGVNTVTTGDLLYGSASNTWSKLAAGSAYKSLVMNGAGTNVEWNAVALNQSGSVSGALPETNGGTNQTTYTLGDVLYSSAANTLAKLAGNTTTTKKFLTQTGTGAASAAPAWDVVNGADVNGNISGQAGSVANALTAGTYLTSGGTFDGSVARTFTVDATSANTASKVVARDGSGNFSAGTITATLNGNASTATAVTNLAGGAANQLAYQTGSSATSFAAAPVSSGQVLGWNGSVFTWTTTIATATTATNLSGGTVSSTAIVNTGTITEGVFAITGTTPALSPTNGTIQTWTLSGASTPTLGTWADGASMTIMVTAGANTITWTSVTAATHWIGGAYPSLAATGITVLELWKVGGIVYAVKVGECA